MRRKKKRKQFWITFTIVSIIIITVVIALFINNVRNATSGQLNTSYQAGKNVQATLTGGYKISGGPEYKLETAGGKTEIVFNTGDTTIPVNQEFNKVQNIRLKKDETFMVRYKIQNNNPNYTLVCDLETEITNSSNVIIEYSINNVNWYRNSQVIFGANGKIQAFQ